MATATATAVVGGVGLHDRVLEIVGTDGQDHVTLDQVRRGRRHYRLKVHADLPSERSSQRHFKADEAADSPSERSSQMHFRADEVERIHVVLCGGDDRATLAGAISTPIILDGGQGNDQLRGGAGPAILLGDGGDDDLRGGLGRNVIIGGTGEDRLKGKPGGHILIGGTTAYDHNEEALLAILAEWNSDRDYNMRIGNLDGTGAHPRLNGSFFLDKQTVIDDLTADRLLGVLGRDWLLLFDGDLAPELQLGQQANLGR